MQETIFYFHFHSVIESYEIIMWLCSYSAMYINGIVSVHSVCLVSFLLP